MRKSVTAVAVGSAVVALTLTACGSGGSGGSGGGTSAAPTSNGSGSASGAGNGNGAKVGIILPDTQSSQRWVNGDPQALASACKASNLSCDIQNANGSPATMKTIAESMESNGIKILMIVNLDNASGAAIEQEANSKGITTIDYDRLTLGGGAALYISFDTAKIGEQQGQALTQCSQVAGQSAVKYVDVNGSPSDSNAGLIKSGYDGTGGYDGVLSKQPGWTKVADQSIDKWDNTLAGTTFGAMLQANPDLQAVMVANDGMANSVISQLTNQGRAGQVAVAGQDATAQGLQHILAGDQCFTIEKPFALEANAAVKAMVSIANGTVPDTTATVTDTQTNKPVPAVLETPVTITKANVGQPIKDGVVSKDEVCAGSFATQCASAGIS